MESLGIERRETAQLHYLPGAKPSVIIEPGPSLDAVRLPITNGVITMGPFSIGSRAIHAALLAALLACDESGSNATLAPNVALAYTRFVNAVADTGGTDWRFIDQIEFSPTMFGMTFRSFSPYQGTAPGPRKLRIFPTNTDINVTSQFFIDTTVTFAAGVYYTIVHLGYTRPGATPEDRVLIVQDDIPAVTAGNIAVRAVHLGIGLNNQDLYTSPPGVPLPAKPLFSDVTYGQRSAYSNQTPDTMVFRATNAGTATVVATATAPAGAAANPANNLTAIGGSKIDKSVFSVFLFPRSVAGSMAPQTAAFTSPAIVFLVDRHPR